jgi:opacity protein-like surface antigen
MKKTIKAAAALAVISSPAFAANLENPLYIPQAGSAYSKTSGGLLYKKADDSLAHRAQHHEGATEFPIWRVQEDIGYGITDRLSVNGSFGYISDPDIDRAGLYIGRAGFNYRISDGADFPGAAGVIWDVYADAHLGGVDKMKASLIVVDPAVTSPRPPFGFAYDNYTNGRWGMYLGTRVGKTWDDFTLAAFVEIERTFSNSNNEITVSNSVRGLLPSLIGGAAAYVPNSFSVDLKYTWEYTAGVKAFYEIDSEWSLGGALSVKHRADNRITNVNIDNTGLAPVDAALGALKSQFMGNLQDGWDEYIIGLALARQMTESVQVALYGEYTFDNANANSQNGTDVKAEIGARVNIAF